MHLIVVLAFAAVVYSHYFYLFKLILIIHYNSFSNPVLYVCKAVNIKS
ncbi:hypothetical protein HMPREF9019_0899 [Hoylesella timonensis CRIS 5C-B1]|uniref:Uncharacterized protein n=1 Tax=Hoylesella timonensis CRIS 5C-B1 TaxID=679189 RepID=D1VXG3_9BACT|nr:hypothetical protein HMPREF9019_0899 [Hoylesella timonensis CRIS 5C-B1]